MRERTAVVLTVALAAGVPWAAARALAHRVDGALAPALTEATGQPVSVGGLEAGLTGTVRLTDLRVGTLLTADAVEASIALDSLLAGDLGADELRVIGPRLHAAVDERGHSAWHDVLARLAARRRSGDRAGGGGHRLRRIVVSGGDLVLEGGGVEVRARDVELHPQAGGVRLVTGEVSLRGARAGYRGTAELARVGADVALPSLAVERVVATGGRARLLHGATAAELAGIDVVRDDPGDAWRITAELDDRGVPRRVAAALATGDDGRALGLELDRVPLAIVGPLAPAVLDLAGARASGRVTVTAADHATGVLGRLELDGARVRHHALADEPVPVDGTVDVEARLAGGRLELTHLGLARGAAAMSLAGVARWRDGRVVALDATATLAPVECRALVDALPGPLRGPLEQLAMTGALSAAAHVAFDLDRPPAGGPDEGDGVTLDIDLDRRACVVTADPAAIDPRRLATASLETFPDGREVLVGPGVGDWVDPSALPGHVRGAFVAAEDARFWDHRGFDAVQIARSLEIDLREGRMARGGSTITQQLVKNAFLHQRRTLARKLQEAVLTWRVEAVLDKRAILARYLNMVELGPGVYGLAAAAQHWFGKPAGHLTVREAAFLAALTPAPATMTRRLQAAGGLDPATAERVEVTLRAMRRAGVIGGLPPRTALAFRPAALGR